LTRIAPPTVLPRHLRAARSALLAACFAVACAPSTARPPNILLISIDSLRADHLGCYGYGPATSPHLDRLASQGTVYEQAFSTTTWTLPAHLSLLASLYPDEHGVHDRHTRIAEQAELLPERLAAAGYRSRAVVSAPYLDRLWGFDQGWESWDDSVAVPRGIGRNARSHRAINSPDVHSHALAALDELGTGPFLLFVHYWDVHYDYLPPAKYWRRFDPKYRGRFAARNYELSPRVAPGMNPRDLQHVVALYDGEIAWVDDWIGKLFAELERRGLFDDLVIVVTADHGDEFFEHGEKGHRKNLYDTTLQVPLIVRLPHGAGGGRRVTTAVSLVDVAPTLAALAGVPPGADWVGRDLAPRGAGEPPAADLFADLHDELVAIVRGSSKLIVSRRDGTLRRDEAQLYDLAADPLEKCDLAASETERADRLLAALDAARERFGRVAARLPSPPVPNLDRMLEEQLRALGYL